MDNVQATRFDRNNLQANKKVQEACKRGIRVTWVRDSKQDESARNLGYQVSTRVNKRVYVYDSKQNYAECISRKVLLTLIKLKRCEEKLLMCKKVGAIAKWNNKVADLKARCIELQARASKCN